MGTTVFPHIPYRITDVTELDSEGRFWAINYNFPKNTRLQTNNDPVTARYGKGATHAVRGGVERLIEFRYEDGGIKLVDQPPIQLRLLPKHLRNWEGIVRVNDEGFLLITDKYPTTILGFVPLNR